MPKSWRTKNPQPQPQKSQPQPYQTRLPPALTKEHKKILSMSNKQYTKNLYNESFWSRSPKHQLDDIIAFQNLKTLTKFKGINPLDNNSKRTVWHGNSKGSVEPLPRKRLLRKNGDIKLSPNLIGLYEQFGKNNINYQDRIERIQRKYTNNNGITHTAEVEGQVYGKQRFVNNVYRLVNPKPQGLLNEILRNKTITRSTLTKKNITNSTKD